MGTASFERVPVKRTHMPQDFGTIHISGLCTTSQNAGIESVHTVGPFIIVGMCGCTLQVATRHNSAVNQLAGHGFEFLNQVHVANATACTVIKFLWGNCFLWRAVISL